MDHLRKVAIWIHKETYGFNKVIPAVFSHQFHCQISRAAVLPKGAGLGVMAQTTSGHA